MKPQYGLTLIEVIVIIFIITVCLLVWHGLTIVRRSALRTVCGTNLRNIGSAMAVYAQDFDGRYPQLPGTGPWAKELGFAYDIPKPDFSPSGVQGNTPRTVTASWYLLVREADVSPKIFICPYSRQKEFLGKNPNNLDLVQLWDFGPTPYAHVSYAMHHPYGRFPANPGRPPTFVIAADRSPWFKNGDILPPGHNNNPPQIISSNEPQKLQLGNTLNHRFGLKKTSEGQHVLYSDGHTNYETQPNTGVKYDNIYTFWSTDDNPTEQDKQGGSAPTGRTPDNDAKSEDDSFLVI